MKKILIAIFAAASVAGCTVSEDDSRLAVEGQGYTDVELGGFAIFGCGKDDDFTREWKGTDRNGNRVKGVVCGGWLKGNTVRVTGRA